MIKYVILFSFIIFNPSYANSTLSCLVQKVKSFKKRKNSVTSGPTFTSRPLEEPNFSIEEVQMYDIQRKLNDIADEIDETRVKLNAAKDKVALNKLSDDVKELLISEELKLKKLIHQYDSVADELDKWGDFEIAPQRLEKYLDHFEGYQNYKRGIEVKYGDEYDNFVEPTEQEIEALKRKLYKPREVSEEVLNRNAQRSSKSIKSADVPEIKNTKEISIPDFRDQALLSLKKNGRDVDTYNNILSQRNLGNEEFNEHFKEFFKAVEEKKSVETLIKILERMKELDYKNKYYIP